MISVEAVHKRFGEVQALRGVAFTAADGCITGLLGGNGAGKTTLMRIIATLLRPDSGRVTVDGRDSVSEALAVRAGLGVLPHSTALYPRLSGRENIAYFARLHGLDTAQAQRRTEALVTQLDMGAFVDRRAGGYSHGQKTRVALARALVHSPRNLVLDEPSSGLDVAAARALRQTLRELAARGHCVLVSTHLMHEVEQLCDQVVMLADGQVVASGALSELLARSGASDAEEAFIRLSAGA